MRCLDESSIQSAVNDGATLYFKHCRSRVDGFISQHFDLPGAWSTNKVALGWDLIRSPCNLFWAPIYILLQCICFCLSRTRWPSIKAFSRALSNKIPSGITTNVQHHLSLKIQEEILAAPNDSGFSLANLIGDSLQASKIELEKENETIRIIKDSLSQYALTRTASADISNSLLTLIIGAFWFKKFTPGGVAIGIVTAYWLNQKWAINNFFLGEQLGKLYYQIFPSSPSTALLLISIVLTLSILAIIASFSGLVSDPIQSKLGLHRRRLIKMIDAIEKDFLVGKEGRFKPKDQYVARILDLLDAAKSTLL